MTLLIVPILYAAILLFDYLLVTPKHSATRGERILYRVLITLALLVSVPTSIALQLDHVGASLSGLISLFSR